MARTAAEYVALSTINARMTGWDVLARGSDKPAVEQQAWDAIVGNDIYADTLRKNLRVVSRSAALRLAGRCALNECPHDHGFDY